MDVLADSPNGQSVSASLDPLCDAYEAWITEMSEKLSSLSAPLLAVGKENLRRCSHTLTRMREGLEIIRDDPLVFEAFRFANRAMAWQRRQARYAANARKSSDWVQPTDTLRDIWRPFQMAFILQTIAGLVDPSHRDRSVADLLWFPTGGGKTEAYLGLAAFTMAMRRLRKEEAGARTDAGVAVLMRYTLRLLTIQQFQRAAVLVCACEMIRRSAPRTWGADPFRIGLWVGEGLTPNSFEEGLKALQPVAASDSGSPVQLVNCPWCGSPLERKHYRPMSRLRRIIVSCSRPGCDFHISRNPDGIPVVLEDEEVYRLAPTIVIGTVDKFARIPWIPESRSLFGNICGEVPGWGFVVEGEEQETRAHRQQVLRLQGLPDAVRDTRPLGPPDLIIQDELHLISGPLGTMAGLYETAIDMLSSRDCRGVLAGPKVIASTATIRKAEAQVRNLFARKPAVFPPSGLEASDSFFAREQPPSEQSGRLYIGVFAPARSVKTALVRTYAAVLSSVSTLSASPANIDPFYTLVGYFNSLRELGGAVRLLEDDIPARIRVLASRAGAGAPPWFADRPLRDRGEELTSRISSRDIPGILDRMARPYTGPGNGEQPVDVILASNMISVGVDIGRLALMVVTGQPKTTSEYIQATSRVGREHPGLIVTVYNWARPRDLSHYERFTQYHATLYRHVEAVSVTPFAARARDRGLPGVYVALNRQQKSGFGGRAEAAKFRLSLKQASASRAWLLDRLAKLGQPSGEKTVEREIDLIGERWENAAKKGTLNYSGTAPKVMYPLGAKRSGLFAVPNSMRDVETPIGLYLADD